MPVLSNFPCGSGSGSSGRTVAAVTNITTQVASGKVYIKWTDPDDIVANSMDATDSAYWGGTLLLRKAGSVPANRKDGVIVIDSTDRDAYSTTYFCDSGLTDSTTYYYKFFPYTTSGAYTNSTDNEFTATPTAQVTGIDDWCVTNMAASSEAGNGKMTVKWSDPSATIVSDGVSLATWASTTIVVKTGSYPTGTDDADAVYTFKSTTRNQYSSSALTITGLTNGTTYYVSFFPETTDGGVNTSTTQRTTGVANRISITATPSQNGTLTYNGVIQSPTWYNYSSTQLTISGTTVATNAGTYTARFTPATDYRWTGGSTTYKSVTWKINKATGTISTSSSVTLNTSTTSISLSISGNHDGTLSAVSNDESIATVSINNANLEIYSVNGTSGTTTVTLSCSAGTNYTECSTTINVTASFVNTVLNENTWEEISTISKSGLAANYWNIGDCKEITLNGTAGIKTLSNVTYCVYIIDFEADANGNNSGITFGTFKTALTNGVDVCLVDNKYNSQTTNSSKVISFSMNKYNGTNSGGWKECRMRYNALGSTDQYDYYDASTTTATNPVSSSLMSTLPADLRAVMKPMTIYTYNNDGVTATVDYLPLLAEYEVLGSNEYASANESKYQRQYAYFASGNSSVKYKDTSSSTLANWWFRSPCENSSSVFCYNYPNFGSFYRDGDYSYGVAPIFLV